MKSLQEIIKILQEHKSELQKKYPVYSIGIFGSYARGEQKPESDVDILVEIHPKIGLGFISLADELESLLHLKVDLVSKKGVKQHYLPLIQSELIYV